MGNFFRENWPYIVVPFVLALVGVALLLFLAGEGDSGLFIYDIF